MTTLSQSDGGTGKTPVPLWFRLAPLLFVLLWSGGYSAIKIGLGGSEPIFHLALRYMLVLAILVPSAILLRLSWPPRAQLHHLMVVGLLIQGLYFGGTNVAVSLGASAAVLGVVLALQPIVVALVAPHLLGEPGTRLAWLGLVLGLAGALIAILAKSGLGEATAGGVIASFLSLLFISAGTIYEKRFGTTQHPVMAAVIQCGVGLALALPLALALETCRINWTLPFVGSLVYLAVGNSIISMTLLLAMIRAGAAARVSALLFLLPAVSSLMAWVLLAEPLPFAVWIGMGLAAVGVMLVRRS